MQKVLCIVSTYNGERYLKEQLESLYAQELTDAQLDIYVRDDGSKDATVELLSREAAEGKLHFDAAPNAGCGHSFMLALQQAKAYDFVAFCDQDDRWYPDKIQRALTKLAPIKADTPALYTSEYTYCTEDMTPYGTSDLWAHGISFTKQLFENRCSGNTMVANHALIDLLLQADPWKVEWHDWFISLVAESVGELVHDSTPTLDYRRTGNNTSPAGLSGIALLQRRIKTFFVQDHFTTIHEQLKLIYTLYGQAMSSDKRKELELALSTKRFRKAFYPKRWRHFLRDELMVRTLMLAGKL